MDLSKLYAVKNLWECHPSRRDASGSGPIIKARVVLTLGGDILHLLHTLWVHDGLYRAQAQAGIRFAREVAGEHLGESVALNFSRSSNIVVMTRDCRRLFADREDVVRFHTYDDHTCDELVDEVREHLTRAIHFLKAASSWGDVRRGAERTMRCCAPWRFIEDGSPWFFEPPDVRMHRASDVDAIFREGLERLVCIKEIRASWESWEPPT
jgi:hypothetical protein